MDVLLTGIGATSCAIPVVASISSKTTLRAPATVSDTDSRRNGSPLELLTTMVSLADTVAPGPVSSSSASLLRVLGVSETCSRDEEAALMVWISSPGSGH